MMRDEDDVRRRVTQLVYRRLADRQFRNLLTACAEDGSRPVIVALPSDPMHDLIHKLVSAGRAGNVVLPQANGFLVAAISGDTSDESSAAPDHAAPLTPECTVGVFFARLVEDGGDKSYTFVVQGPGDHREAGQAQLVAVGC